MYVAAWREVRVWGPWLSGYARLVKNRLKNVARDSPRVENNRLIPFLESSGDKPCQVVHYWLLIPEFSREWN